MQRRSKRLVAVGWQSSACACVIGGGQVVLRGALAGSGLGLSGTVGGGEGGTTRLLEQSRHSRLPVAPARFAALPRSRLPLWPLCKHGLHSTADALPSPRTPGSNACELNFSILLLFCLGPAPRIIPSICGCQKLRCVPFLAAPLPPGLSCPFLRSFLPSFRQPLNKQPRPCFDAATERQ